MKKILTITALIAISYFLFGFNSNEPVYINSINPNTQMITVPDVMNKINVLENDANGFHNVTMSADSFPNFPGFPKHVAGTITEGGAIFCNMDSDPEPEIVFCASYTIYAINLDGSNVPGWPKTVTSGTIGLDGAPAFGDIDGDGQGEIVAVSHGPASGGYVYAFKKNGDAVTGFPINNGYCTRTPVLADLDNNGTLEIIVNERVSHTVRVYKGDGTMFPGWPQTMNHVPASSAAVGDITGDGVPEIIAESYNSLYAWHTNGDTVAGFPFTMPNGDNNSYSSPVLADLDGDNIREIIFGTHALSGGGYVYALKNNGTVMTGWPKITPYWIYSPPAIGYIDGDNVLDISVGDGGGTISGTPVFSLYAWNKNGTALTGFPVTGLWAINNQPVIADIDNDNMSELIIDDNTTESGLGKYPAFNHDGTPVSGWPVYTSGSTSFRTPCVLDINNDGILDIIGEGGEGTYPTDFTNLYLWNTGMNLNIPKTYNAMWQYNARHNAVFGDNPLVGVIRKTSGIPKEFKLYQNYPNPFNPSTAIKFDVPKSGNVKIEIFNMLGQNVETLVNGDYVPGGYTVVWNALNNPSGVYFYRLNGTGFTGTGKMVLLK